MINAIGNFIGSCFLGREASPPNVVFGTSNIIWFRSREGVTVDGSNNVTSWNTSVNSLSETLTGVASFLPTRVTDANGVHAIRFSESAMNLSALTGFSDSATNYTLILVWKYRGPITTATKEEGRSLNNSTGNRIVAISPQTNTAILRYNLTLPTSLTTTSGPVPENLHIVEYNMTAPSSANIKINGVQDVTNGNYTQMTFSPGAGFASFGNGVGVSSSSNLNGDVYEWLLVKGTYTDSQKRSVYNWFDDLYNEDIYDRGDFTSISKTTALDTQSILYTGTGTDDYLAFPSIAIHPTTNKLYGIMTEGPNHNNSLNAFITFFTSTDSYTWSSRTTIVPPDGINKLTAGGICVTNTGRILAKFHKVHATDPAGNSFIIYSDDDGVTWNSNGSDGNEIPVAGSAYPYPGQETGQGNPIQLANGRILIPLYARTGASGNRECVIWSSIDDGLTWTAYATMAVTSVIDPEEPEIIIRPDGILIGLIRSDPQASIFQTYSFDDGVTWACSQENSTNRNLAFAGNGFACAAMNPNYTMMGLSRLTTGLLSTTVHKSTNKGQNFTVATLEANTNLYLYGKGQWHPGINKFVFIHAREKVGSPGGNGPTEIVLTHWNEINV